MATLPAGVQYGLSSETANRGVKDLVFVKLTDSALRSIEEFIRNMGKIESTPTIQFLPGDVGKISIPNGSTQPVTFRFNLASNTEMEGPQGSLECLEAAGNRHLRTLGSLPTRMRVLANEDVYENTKKKMASETENQKKNCTRVIKPNQTDIGRKVKVKQQRHPQPPSRNVPPPSSLGPLSSSSLHPNRSVMDPIGNINNSSNSVTNVSVLHGSNTGSAYSNGVHIGNSNSHGYSSVNSYTGVYSGGGGGGGYNANNTNHNHMKSNISNFNSNLNNVNLSNNVNNGNNGGGHYGVQHPPSAGQPRPQGGHLNTARQPPPNPDLLKRPIKERLIQLLALRPYKKPELYARITSEGIKEREKGVIKTILMQISSLKDNCYQLHRHLWNDVNEDWPFYSEEEKQLLKRRKPQNLTPPLSSDSGHSPSPPPQSHKRAAPSGNTLSPSTTPNNNSNGNGQPPIKKQRISHYKKPTQHDSNSREGSGSPAALSNGYHSSTSMSSGERKSYSDEDIPPPTTQLPGKRENDYSLSLGTTAKNFLGTPPNQNGYDSAIMATHTSPVKNNISPASSSTRDKSPDSTTNQQENSDFASEYPEIRNAEQRRRYKAEFAAQYIEYRELHTKVETVTQVFMKLEEKLRLSAGGPMHKEIQRQIVEEYQKRQQDVEYQREMAQFKHLHLKLAYIKNLVHKYDTEHQDITVAH